MLTREEVHALVANRLAAMGSTAQDWYERLLAGGHFGRPHRSKDCPVTRKVQKELADAGVASARVLVDPADVIVFFGSAVAVVTVDMPTPGSEFVDAFDRGLFPALEVPA